MAKVVLFIFLRIFYIARIDGHITTRPKDQIVVKGEEVRLDCSTNLSYPVTWWFTAPGATDSDEFYFSQLVKKSYSEKHSVETSKPGHYMIFIKNVEEDHGGKYTCYENEGEGPDKASMELTVIDSEPECDVQSVKTRQDGFSLELRCNITIFGNLVPDITWSYEGNGTAPSVFHNQTVEEFNNTFVFTANFDSSTWSVNEITATIWFNISHCDQISDKCFSYSKSLKLTNDQLLKLTNDQLSASGLIGNETNPGQQPDNQIEMFIIGLEVVLPLLVGLAIISFLIRKWLERKENG